ncbi:MAG TPA: DUF2784 domain-containing protein [Nitrospiria bacterium]|nr:DUF2784 domain-containing protein [Nitrospiria bacterium]
MPTFYAVLADVTLITHALFVAFVICGQAAVLVGWVRDWRWPRRATFRGAHLVAIGGVVLKSWLGVPCVLTVLENALRARSGAAPYQETFIAHWVGRLLFYPAPPWVFTLAYSLFALLTLATLIAYPPTRSPR